MAGSDGNQPKPWLDPQGTRDGREGRILSCPSSLASQRLVGRRSVPATGTGLRYSLAPG